MPAACRVRGSTRWSGSRRRTVPGRPAPAPAPVIHEEPVVAAAPKPDELTEKLKKLRTLFDNGLISQDEYNAKKLELLSDL